MQPAAVAQAQAHAPLALTFTNQYPKPQVQKEKKTKKEKKKNTPIPQLVTKCQVLSPPRRHFQKQTTLQSSTAPTPSSHPTRMWRLGETTHAPRPILEPALYNTVGPRMIRTCTCRNARGHLSTHQRSPLGPSLFMGKFPVKAQIG